MLLKMANLRISVLTSCFNHVKKHLKNEAKAPPITMFTTYNRSQKGFHIWGQRGPCADPEGPARNYANISFHKTHIWKGNVALCTGKLFDNE